ncbi:putative cell cycle checkpoint protein Rad17 [Aspergillus undulatus]|uniref:putative cell cycle checkpoint protein Rad17 n=1 Tax=Aspergillus undulatus TaxID=1810928 RepID=UPI003CCDCC62
MDDSEDSIEDDYDSYDELFTQHFTDDRLSQLDGMKAVPTAQDRSRSPASEKPANVQRQSGNNTKRFLLHSKSSSKPEVSNSTQSAERELPWAQRYAPRTPEELAVHKKKVRDVEHWLNDALAGKPRRKLLVLKGPAGCGKTATISLLSDKLNFSVLEWKTPSAAEYASKDYISLGAQFDEFLSRGHKFGVLDLDGRDNTQIFSVNQTDTSQRRVILIEEFPTFSGRVASALAAFRLSILRYISMDTSSARTDLGTDVKRPPIIMIVTETFSGSDTSFDNLSAQRLLGREIYNHLSTSIIEFNRVAPTFMLKALNLVLKKSALQMSGSQALAQSTIANISEGGDIRNAVASLEFLSQGSGNKCSWSSKPTVKSKRITRGHKNVPPIRSETPGELVPRSATLGLFHAVGKIVYNKRDHSSETASQQPTSLFDQPGISLVHVNSLSDEAGTDIQSFISALQENYVASCNGPTFTECLDGCARFLSDSDMICCEQRGHASSLQAGLGIGILKSGASIDLLRQEEISYQVAARGLLFALPCPVKRQIPGINNAKRSKDSHKLSFPPVIRLVRHYEEIQGLIGSWRNALLGSDARPLAVSVSDCDQRIRRPIHEGSNITDSSSSIATLTSRSDLILHQLPYMTMILGENAGPMRLDAITVLGAQRSDYGSQLEEDHEYDLPAQGHGDSDLRESKVENRIGGVKLPQHLGQQVEDERLILSDDDIVDDQ